MIIDAPQEIKDEIIDRMIDDACLALGRWVMELDCCSLDFRRREGICSCGDEYVGRR